MSDTKSFKKSPEPILLTNSTFYCPRFAYVDGLRENVCPVWDYLGYKLTDSTCYCPRLAYVDGLIENICPVWDYLGFKLANSMCYCPRFAYVDGLIEYVCPEATEVAWVLNIKKAIVGNFQNVMEDLTRTTRETEVRNCFLDFFRKTLFH